MISRKALRKLTYALVLLTLLAAALIYLGDRTTPVDTQAEETAATPGFVGADASEPFPVDGMTQDTEPSVVARSAVTQYSNELGIDAETVDFSVERVRETEDGRSSVRLQQVVAGVPVIAGELVVNLTSDNQLLSIGGEVTEATDIAQIPEVSSDGAVEVALAGVNKWYGLDAGSLVPTVPELSVYDPALLEPSIVQPALVWLVEVSAGGAAPVNEYVLINAVTGGIALHFNQVDAARDRLTYDAGNVETIPGTLACNEADSDCTGGDTDAKDAHVGARDVYDFYSTTHGRDSYNNAGATMKSTTDYGNDRFHASPYRNAFWDSALDRTVFADDFGADDVVAHEWTHAVTSYESGLLYYYQSGAINESLSDVWGELIDHQNGRGDDSAGAKWLMGEDIYTGAIRNMKTPESFGDPPKMTSGNYYQGSADSGGVHTNSGVNNKAAYLLTDGDTYNGHIVDAIGPTKVAKIYYEVQTNLLTSGSNYNDLYNYLYQGCQNLVGTDGITSGDCDNVREATDAVEMNLEPFAGFQPLAQLCPNGSQPTEILLADDIESGGGSWNVIAGGSPWVIAPGFAASGTKSLYNPDPDEAHDGMIYHNPVSITGDVFLHFKHAFSFDAPDFDGGAIEYDLNSSGVFTDAGSLIIDGKFYNGTVNNGFGNPLGGRQGYIGDSHGYVSTLLDLRSLSGNDIRLMYRAAGDSVFSGPIGWVIDDYSLHVCDLTAPALTLTSSPATPDGLAGWYASIPDISFSADETADVEFQLDATGDGSWSPVTAPVTAAEGVHTYYFKATDPSGNVGTADVSLSVDTTPPTAPAITGKMDGPDTADVSWTPSTDGGSGLSAYRIKRPGGPTGVTVDSGTTSATSPALGSGCSTTVLLVEAIDVAGNSTSSDNYVPSTNACRVADDTSQSMNTIENPTTIKSYVDSSPFAGDLMAGFNVYDWPTGDVVASPAGRFGSITGLATDESFSFFIKVRDSGGNLAQPTGVFSVTPGNGGTTDAGAGVSPVTVAPQSDISITFDDVISGGQTTSSTLSSPPTEPSGFSFLGDVIDISTSAAFTGLIDVSIRYNEADIGVTNEESLRLFHFEGGSWADVTTHVDTHNNVIHGSVSSLSPFGMGGPALQATGGSSLTWLAGLALVLVGGLLHLRVLRQRV